MTPLTMKGTPAASRMARSSSTDLLPAVGSVLKERQTCGIDVHGYGEGMGVVYQSHFFTDGFDIPGFDGGDTKTGLRF